MYIKLLFALFFGSVVCHAQDMEALIKGEQEVYTKKINYHWKRSGQSYDIAYHCIKLAVDPSVRFIEGSVYSELVALEDNFSNFSFDLDTKMRVDSVVYNAAQVVFVQVDDVVRITVPSHSKGEMVAVEVFYHGDPSQNVQKGFSYGFQHDGPIAWTLSEPYGAYGWWPNKQQLEDKIDSLDMEITIPKGNKAAGIGTLENVDTLADSSLVYHWKHRYPIVPYLVALAVTNYYEESHYIPLYDGDSLFHLDYIYPAYKPAADTLRWKINGMMRAFDSLFGHYPFRNEKYGHAMFGRGGGMEHQTMSFMSNLHFDLMAHELGHQWFGNKITCGSWADLWLNEGWATYSNALAREFVLGKESFLDFMTESKSRTIQNSNGAVYAYDTVNVGELFKSETRYYKGSMVLQQLRWELGDSLFFAGTRKYMSNADVCYGVAYTADFKEIMEETSGKDLTDFFDRYVYKEGFPIITTRWNRISSSKIKLKISQRTSDASVSFFPLKIEYRASNAERDTFFVVDHSDLSQEKVVDLGFKVKKLEYDPNIWLISAGTTLEGTHVDLSSVALFPNPSDNSVSVFVKDRKLDNIELLDIQGRLIKKLDIEDLKNNITNVDVSGLTNGMYLIRASSGSESVVLKFTKAAF